MILSSASCSLFAISLSIETGELSVNLCQLIYFVLAFKPLYAFSQKKFLFIIVGKPHLLFHLSVPVVYYIVIVSLGGR